MNLRNFVREILSENIKSSIPQRKGLRDFHYGDELWFSKILKKNGYTTKNDEFKVRVLLKGDGEELDRMFDIEVGDWTMMTKEQMRELGKDYEFDHSTEGWNLFGEESEWR